MNQQSNHQPAKQPPTSAKKDDDLLNQGSRLEKRGLVIYYAFIS
jgi:hypothetical protein